MSFTTLHGLETDWRGVTYCGHTQGPLTADTFSYKKQVMDILWGQNFAPDLLELVLEQSHLVQEEL